MNAIPLSGQISFGLLIAAWLVVLVIYKRRNKARGGRGVAGQETNPIMTPSPAGVSALGGEHAELLHQDDPVQRLGAMNALEQLAQNDPWYRQVVVSLLCAWLRENTGDDVGCRRAQHILADHLHPTPAAQFWGALDLDLDGATLVGFDLSDCQIGRLSAVGARFVGASTLRGSRCMRPASFAGAVFDSDARFDGMHFDTVVDLGASFGGRSVFCGSVFSGETRFAGARFAGPADFSGTIFLVLARFSDTPDGPASFADRVLFRDACLYSSHFGGVNFAAGVDLTDAHFASTPTYRVGDGVLIEALAGALSVP